MWGPKKPYPESCGELVEHANGVTTRDWVLQDYFVYFFEMGAPYGRTQEVWTATDGYPPGTSPETHEGMWVSRSGCIYEGTNFGFRATFIRPKATQ